MSIHLLLAHIGHPRISALHLALRKHDIPIELRNIIVEHYFPFLPNEEVPLTFAQFQELISGNVVAICSNYLFDGTCNYRLKSVFNYALKSVHCRFESVGKSVPEKTVSTAAYWYSESYKLSDFNTTEELYHTMIRVYRYMLLHRLHPKEQ